MGSRSGPGQGRGGSAALLQFQWVPAARRAPALQSWGCCLSAVPLPYNGRCNSRAPGLVGNFISPGLNEAEQPVVNPPSNSPLAPHPCWGRAAAARSSLGSCSPRLPATPGPVPGPAPGEKAADGGRVRV